MVVDSDDTPPLPLTATCGGAPVSRGHPPRKTPTKGIARKDGSLTPVLEMHEAITALRSSRPVLVGRARAGRAHCPGAGHIRTAALTDNGRLLRAAPPKGPAWESARPAGRQAATAAAFSPWWSWERCPRMSYAHLGREFAGPGCGTGGGAGCSAEPARQGEMCAGRLLLLLSWAALHGPALPGLLACGVVVVLAPVSGGRIPAFGASRARPSTARAPTGDGPAAPDTGRGTPMPRYRNSTGSPFMIASRL